MGGENSGKKVTPEMAAQDGPSKCEMELLRMMEILMLRSQPCWKIIKSNYLLLIFLVLLVFFIVVVLKGLL